MTELVAFAAGIVACALYHWGRRITRRVEDDDIGEWWR